MHTPMLTWMQRYMHTPYIHKQEKLPNSFYDAGVTPIHKPHKALTKKEL